MRRTQVQLDEHTYEELKRRAFERGISMSALLREILRSALAPGSTARRGSQLRFFASGQSDQGNLAPISERHDEALAEDFGR